MYTGDRLNFSISFNPTAGFPLDARSYFTSLSEAEEAAKTAVETAGSADSAYYVGQTLVVVDTAKNITNLYIIAADKTLKQIIVAEDTATHYVMDGGDALEAEQQSLSEVAK